MIPPMAGKLDGEIAVIGDLSRDELVARWVKAHGCPPPKGIKRGLLERSAAWLLQAKRLGGLNPDVGRTLKRLVAGERSASGGTVADPGEKTTDSESTKHSQPSRAGFDAVAHDPHLADCSARLLSGDVPRSPAPSNSSPAEPAMAASPALPANPAAPLRARPAAGTRLVREWNGRMHVVEVIDDGFVWDGKSYRSLSAIAKRITGAHWSGPRFFGL